MGNKLFGLVFCLSFFTSALGFGQNHLGLWQSANTAYEGGDFSQATALYEQLVATQKADDQVYYNLGNTYYRMQEIGKAVLNYRRALTLNPHNKWAKENIQFIQSKTPNAVFELPEIFFIRWANAFLGFAPANVWAWITAGFFILSLVVLYLKLFRNLRNGYRWLSFTAALFLLCAFITFVAYENRFYHDEAVVMIDKAVLHEKNDNQSKLLLMLPEGTTLKILEEKGHELLKVRLPNGSVGWVDAREIEKI